MGLLPAHRPSALQTRISPPSRPLYAVYFARARCLNSSSQSRYFENGASIRAGPRNPLMPTRQAHQAKHALLRATILLLVFGIVGLSALAKQSLYLSKSNPARFLSSATKFDAPLWPGLPAPVRTPPITLLFPSQPEPRTTLLAFPEKGFPPQIGLSVSRQHRAPPAGGYEHHEVLRLKLLHVSPCVSPDRIRRTAVS